MVMNRERKRKEIESKEKKIQEREEVCAAELKR
jgi:hypothetical protein